jgi:hypothetical protein
VQPLADGGVDIALVRAVRQAGRIAVLITATTPGMPSTCALSMPVTRPTPTVAPTITA